MIKPKPIIGRVGGKVRLAPWIIEHLKRFQWSIYCEPFAGSAAVYFRLIQEGIFEKIKERGHHPRVVLCDADSRIIQLFKTCRDHPELLAYAVAMTPYSREEHKLAQQSIDGIEDEIEQARRYLVDGWQSPGGDHSHAWGTRNWTDKQRGGNDRTTPDFWHSLPQRILAASPHLQGEPNPINSRHILNDAGRSFVEPSVDVRVEMARRYLVDGWQSFTHKQGGSWGTNNRTIASENGGLATDFTPEMWHTLPQRILTATEHLKKCYIENDDAVKCIKRWATPHTAIYADPLYYDCSHYYKEDFDNDQHARLAECLHNVEAACVIVSYYPHPEILKLYSEDDWEYHYKNTVASSAGITRNSKTRTRPKRTELLLVRKQRNPEKTIVSLSGQTSLF